MSYTFRYTEQNLETSADFETKSLLYLIGIDSDRLKIHYIFIDCFNDVTGGNESCDSLWDYQSKGIANMTPRKLGKSLITLFENYLEDLNFAKFSIFIPKPKAAYVVNNTALEFGIANFGVRITEIKAGLKDEFIRRNPDRIQVALGSSKVDEFLECVNFVADRGEKHDFVKNLVSFKDMSIKTNDFYSVIFNEIRTVQVAKKINRIHGLEVSAIPDVLAFEKHLKARDIRVLVINRIIGSNILKNDSVPIEFIDEVEGLNRNDLKDLITDCSIKVSKAFFDKNGKMLFWGFLECALTIVYENPTLTAREVYDAVVVQGAAKCRHLTEKASIYLISLIQQGLHNESN